MSSEQNTAVEAGAGAGLPRSLSRPKPSIRDCPEDPPAAAAAVDTKAKIPGQTTSPNDTAMAHTYPPNEKVFGDDQSSTHQASDDDQADSKDEKDKERDHMRLRDMLKGEHSYHKREHWW